MLRTLLLFIVLTVAARAQFTLPTAVTADSQVDASGSTYRATSVSAVFALNFGGPGNTSDVVNGVNFTGVYGDGVAVLGGGFFNDAEGGVIQTAGISDAFYDALKTSLNSYGTPGSVTINGLTAGHTYEFQLFGGSTSQTGTETISDGTNSTVLAFGIPATSGAEVTTDTVLATSSSITFSFTALTGTDVLVNAFNVRDE